MSTSAPLQNALTVAKLYALPPPHSARQVVAPHSPPVEARLREAAKDVLRQNLADQALRKCRSRVDDLEEQLNLQDHLRYQKALEQGEASRMIQQHREKECVNMNQLESGPERMLWAAAKADQDEMVARRAQQKLASMGEDGLDRTNLQENLKRQQAASQEETVRMIEYSNSTRPVSPESIPYVLNKHQIDATQCQKQAMLQDCRTRKDLQLQQDELSRQGLQEYLHLQTALCQADTARMVESMAKNDTKKKQRQQARKLCDHTQSPMEHIRYDPDVISAVQHYKQRQQEAQKEVNLNRAHQMQSHDDDEAQIAGANLCVFVCWFMCQICVLPV